MRKLHYQAILSLLPAFFFCSLPLVGQVLTNPSDCGLGIVIPDANCEIEALSSPLEVQIMVNNAPGALLGVDVFLEEVQLIIKHGWLNDVEVSLVSPGGRVVLLTADNGEDGDNYGVPSDSTCLEYATFSSLACVSVKNGAPPYTDKNYRPEGSFFDFNDSITNPNGIWTLLLCDDVQFDAGSLEFVNLVFRPIECLPVVDVNILEVDTTTVKLNWNPLNFCGTVIVEYGPPGFEPGVDSLAGEGEVVFAECPPFSLQGLQETTDYEVYLRRYCQGEGFSQNSCPIAIRTSCLPPPATITETFDGFDICAPLCNTACRFDGLWRNVDGDQLDWIVNQGPTDSQGTGPPGDVNGGGNYIYIETSGSQCSSGAEAILHSNCILLNKQGTDTCHLSFNYHMFGLDISSLRLQASADGGFNWSTLWQRNGNQGDKWHKAYIGLSGFEDGQVLQFRFIGRRGNGSKGDIAIDNIVIYGSEDLGFPTNQYYVDADGDGFGRPGAFVLSCAPSPPAGFAGNDDDCNDNNPSINPAAPEIPCDGVDNNCNAGTINDDTILPPPVVVNDTVCSGEQATICATPVYTPFILWYGSPDGDDLVGFGTCFSPLLPENNSPTPVVHRFYAVETNFVCISETRTEVVVVVFPKPDVSTPDMPSICPGEAFDLTGLTIEDANYTGGTTTFHSGTPAGAANQLLSTIVSPSGATTYYFKVTSPEGCTDENSVALFVKSSPSLSFSPADSFSLCRENTQVVSVQASGGAGSYSYLWSQGTETPQITVAAAPLPGTLDSYQVTVTDSEGCFSTGTVLVNTTNSIDSVRRTVANVSVCMGNDGSITVIPLNGQSPFSFQWTGSNGSSGSGSGVADTILIGGLSQGSYRVTITDSSEQMCEFKLRNILVNGPDAVVQEPVVSHVSCFGAMNGSICLNVSGNNPQYLWSDGTTESCIENLPGGIYSVTVTDGMCATILDQIVVNEPDSIKIKPSISQPSCFEANDGAIDLAVFDGTPPYSFLWSNNAATEDINNLAAGAYTVTITDANGCILIQQLILQAPTLLSVALDSIRAVSCNELSDGYLKVNGAGGTPPYQYIWNTGSSSPVQSNLAPGVYSVTVTDFNGCQRTASFGIAQPAPLTLQLVATTAPICVGDMTGQIEVAAFGGTPPYIFLWDGVENGNVFGGLGVGAYHIQVMDANGCLSNELNMELSAVSVLDLAINITPPACVGPQTGMVSLQPNGIPPFSFQWDRGDTTQNLPNTGVGIYGVTILDGRGCVYDTSVLVQAPQVFDVDIDVFQPSCHTTDDGFIEVTLLSSGTPPISYSWSDGSIGQDLFGAPQGVYVATITDADGCVFVSDSLHVVNPPPLALKIDGVGQILCHGDSTGFIELDMTGGTPPYQFNWIGINQITEDVHNLPAGSYRVLIQDSNFCPFDTTFILTQPAKLIADVQVNIGDICIGDTTRQLIASASGGVPAYQFLWSNGAMEDTIHNAAPGDYSITVTDANGCTDRLASIKVRDQGAPLNIDTFYVTPITCNGSMDGTVTTVISGGLGEYLYQFQPTFFLTTTADSITRSGLGPANNIRVTVLDINTGCSRQSTTLSIVEPPPIFISRDLTRHVSCFGGNDGAVFISVSGGVSPYSFAWYDENGAFLTGNEDIVNVFGGTYTVEVTDANGCISSIADIDVLDVNEVIHLVDSLTVIQDARCRGDSSGSVLVTATGGSPPFTYQWSNGSVMEDLLGVPEGVYSLTVTDSDTCRAIFTDVFQVGQPATELLVSATSVAASCFDSFDGSIAATISGGDPPYAIDWAYEGNFIEFEHDDSIQDIQPGTYTLMVEDGNQCVRQLNIEVGSPPPLEVRIEIIPPDPPNGEVRATVSVDGGTSPYSYLWSTGDTTATVDGFGEGMYSVTVTDENGCSAADTVVVVSAEETQVLLQKALIYPNPSSGLLILDLHLAVPADLDVELFNNLGQRTAFMRKPKLLREKVEWDLSTLPAGAYWLIIRAEGIRVLMQKVILMRG